MSDRLAKTKDQDHRNVSRRQFVQTTASVAVAASGLPRWARAKPTDHPLIDNLGLQLYTVREPLATQPQQTIEAIQQAGYRQIELFDTQLLPQLQPVFKGLGITINSAHFLPPLVTGNWAPLVAFGTKPPPADYTFEKAVAQAAEYGLTHLVFPFVYPQDRGGIDFYIELAEKLNRAGEVCRQADIQLSYHHHAFEFQPMEDTSPLRLLLEHTDSALMHLQVDVFWASVAGRDPAQFIREVAGGPNGRSVSMLHLKDKKANLSSTFLDSTLPPDAFQPVGSGALNFQEIVRAAEEVGVQHCFVEQDESAQPLTEIRHSSHYLKNLFKL